MWQFLSFRSKSRKTLEFIAFVVSKQGGCHKLRFSLTCLQNAEFYSIWDLQVWNLPGNTAISQQWFPEMPYFRAFLLLVETNIQGYLSRGVTGVWVTFSRSVHVGYLSRGRSMLKMIRISVPTFARPFWDPPEKRLLRPSRQPFSVLGCLPIL